MAAGCVILMMGCQFINKKNNYCTWQFKVNSFILIGII
jgi:hypothetical protein